jgi:hypothetical protein
MNYNKKSNKLSYNERNRRRSKLRMEEIKNKEAHGVKLNLIQKVRKFFTIRK